MKQTDLTPQGTLSASARRIHLDYAATTPLDPEVFSSMTPYFTERGNPSSIHTSGRNARQTINEAREQIAHTIGASTEEIIFTGSGTESDNLALIGTARANQKYGKHIIISAVEHKAVLQSADLLKEEGFEISVAPVDETGQIDLETVCNLVRDDTILVSIILGNNEIGTIQPIVQLIKILKERRPESQFPLFHTDACQTISYLKTDVAALGVDLMTCNGSKIYGPKGIGILYKRTNVALSPLIVGGGQEYGYRAGTESVPLIIGLAKALEKSEILRNEEAPRLNKLRKYFIEKLTASIPQIIINGPEQAVLPHIVHVSIPHIEGESMVLMLDEVGIEAATGSACSAKDLRPSHVLQAMGQDEELIHGSVRFSFGRETTQEQLEVVVKEFANIIEKLTAMSALTSHFYEKTK